MRFSLFWPLLGHPVVFSIETGVINIFVNQESHRAFINASLGLEHIDAYSHQCDSKGKRKATSFVKEPDEMVYTPNRRLQSDTVSSALEGNIQTGVILALGGHNGGPYDYGPAGSLNGLMSVWDSWRSYFFTETSNTTSLVLLLDERDFLHQNITSVVGEYVDILVMKNMGASRVQCASASEMRIVDFKSVMTDKSKSGNSVEKNMNKDRSSKPDIPKACSNVLGSLDQVLHLI
jgi:hypothetical protein